MESKIKVITTVTCISGIIATGLIVFYFLGLDMGIELGILFIAITEMLIGIGQYEISKDSTNKPDKIMANLSFFAGVIVILLLIFMRVK
ncbi:hypothetical protein [uncultured Clostridium sp.]|uniref:hypothetical protein n=1 Tax=uncultured Clostridium sp. TaxID=59620 RepID=UPI00263385D8|nr:hypothetical protein [uncultured Clostridium sp.]